MSRRNTYTPTDAPQVRSNCDAELKTPRGRGGVQRLKTLPNRPDEDLILASAKRQNLRVSVYVLNQRSQPLMPTTPRKAEKLLKEGKAIVVKRAPFTIQLTYSTGENKQPIRLGVDSGFVHVGLSAVSKKQELYSAEVQLRIDIVNLLSERRSYRRNRRNRKTRYRQARFLNRGIKKGWRAPSIQHKLDSHIRLVNKVKQILPITEVVVEVASFDIQKIKNPEISGKQYQEGEQKDFWNTREYILHRDDHKCCHCKGKSKDPILSVHHLESRKTGGDKPANLITLCKTCHDDYHGGKIELKAKPSKGFKAEVFMTMVRWRLVEQLQCRYIYGYVTKQARVLLGLPKSHINDAFVIVSSGACPRSQTYFIKQVRKQNRKLFKGLHSGIRNTATRYIQGFQRYDKVLWKGQECFVFGRRTTGYFDLRLLDGTKVHTSAKAKDCVRLESGKTLLTQIRSSASSPWLKPRVSALEIQ